jgi:hypothetical protein
LINERQPALFTNQAKKHLGLDKVLALAAYLLILKSAAKSASKIDLARNINYQLVVFD